MFDNVSDRELIMELARRLNLSEYPEGELDQPPSNCYTIINQTRSIEFGGGKGHPNTSCLFVFKDEKLMEHQVWVEQ